MTSDGGTKMYFIRAYFDDLDARVELLTALAAAGYRDEAMTLCLVYLDGLAQKLCWPCTRNGVNFVRALSDHTSDAEMGLVHPLQLFRALDGMALSWQPVAAAVQTGFPGPLHELIPPSGVLAQLRATLTASQTNDLERELWRGTVAAVAYFGMRNPAVHALGASDRSFSQTMFAGRLAQPLDLARLQRAARELAADARQRSEATGEWFGNDATLSG